MNELALGTLIFITLFFLVLFAFGWMLRNVGEKEDKLFKNTKQDGRH